MNKETLKQTEELRRQEWGPLFELEAGAIPIKESDIARATAIAKKAAECSNLNTSKIFNEDGFISSPPSVEGGFRTPTRSPGVSPTFFNSGGSPAKSLGPEGQLRKIIMDALRKYESTAPTLEQDAGLVDSLTRTITSNRSFRALTIFALGFDPKQDQSAINTLSTSIMRCQSVDKLLSTLGRFLIDDSIQNSTKNSLMSFVVGRLSNLSSQELNEKNSLDRDGSNKSLSTSKKNTVKEAIKDAMQSKGLNFELNFGYSDHATKDFREAVEKYVLLAEEQNEYVILSGFDKTS